jgi:ABC-type transporter MlaC component
LLSGDDDGDDVDRGPRVTVESAVARFMTILQSGHAAGAAPPAKLLGEVREMFDFDEISRRALSKHRQALRREEQVKFVALFQDLLERAYLTQLTMAGTEKITSRE